MRLKRLHGNGNHIKMPHERDVIAKLSTKELQTRMTRPTHINDDTLCVFVPCDFRFTATAWYLGCFEPPNGLRVGLVERYCRKLDMQMWRNDHILWYSLNTVMKLTLQPIAVWCDYSVLESRYRLATGRAYIHEIMLGKKRTGIKQIYAHLHVFISVCVVVTSQWPI